MSRHRDPSRRFDHALEQVGFRLLAAGLTSCLEDPERAEAEGYPITEVERLFLKIA